MDTLFETYRGREDDPGGQHHLKVEGNFDGHHYLWAWEPKLRGSIMIGFTPEEYVEFVQAITPEAEWSAVWVDGYRAGLAEVLEGITPVNPHVPDDEDAPECTCDIMAHPCEVHDTEHPDVVRGPDWSPYCTCGHHQSEHRKGGDECNPCGANGEGEDASPNCARFESVSDVRPAKVLPTRDQMARMIVMYSGSLGVHYMDVAQKCADHILADLKERGF